MCDHDEYQLGHVDGVPKETLAADTDGTLSALIDGADLSEVHPAALKDALDLMPSTGWRLIRGRGERNTQDVWAAPDGETGDWWVIGLSHRGAGRPKLHSGFEPMRLFPARRIRRQGLELRWVNASEAVDINELRAHRFEFDLVNVSDQVWTNVGEDSICMNIWPLLDEPVYVVFGTDHLLPNLAPGESIRLTGKYQGPNLELGEYRLRGGLSTLGLGAAPDCRLTLRAAV